MSEISELNFKVSSALKNIIGRDLINNRFIAVFELVKNAYDAGANNVTIRFKNLKNEKAEISIIDDGCGMNIDDIQNKWLFVAYSEKKINGNRAENYRNQISKRIFAGAKGVGRFSCDRLGKLLNITTKKYDDKVNSIDINWDKFEVNDKNEFENIPVKHKYLDKLPSKYNNGTILTIKELREVWTRKDILDLKKSLKKLSNPSSENDDFSIYIEAEEEILEDNKVKTENERVNGKIENDIIEKLGLKTTVLEIEIPEDGNKIITKLEDRGVFLFEISQTNNFYKLKNIKIYLSYLNTTAKMNFTRLMGINPKDYGSIFVYKNGFRILPYGEPGQDMFDIDQRKSQGYNRFLGTRELIGRIEILGENKELTETSSRDGGLIKNETFEQLSKFFVENALKVLEKYVVETIKWGEPYKINKNDKDEDKKPAIQPEDVTGKVIEQISKIAAKNKLIDVNYNPDILNKIDERKEESVESSINQLEKIAQKKDDENLLNIAKNLKKNAISLHKAKQEAEKETDKIKKDLKNKEEEINIRKKQNYFLENITSRDTDKLIGAAHTSRIYSLTIGNDIENVMTLLNEEKLNINEIQNILARVSKVNQKNMTLSEYMLKASFSMDTDSLKEDIGDFIIQYVEEIYNKGIDKGLKIKVNKKDEDNICNFMPLSMGVIIGNIVSNSEKAEASQLTIEISKENEYIKISFLDNGKGIDKNVAKAEDLFELGYTTTNGSGVGLYNIKEMVEEMEGKVEITKDLGEGFELTMKVRR